MAKNYKNIWSDEDISQKEIQGNFIFVKGVER